MKKLFLSILLLFSVILLTAQSTLAVEVSYTWNSETTHTFDYFDINKTKILVDDVVVFEYGVILDDDYDFDFFYQWKPGLSSSIEYKPNGSFKEVYYTGTTYGRTGSGTYFNDKEVKWVIDEDYEPEIIYHQVKVDNYITRISNSFVEEGTVISQPSNPTRSGYVFQYWFDVESFMYESIYEEINFNAPVTKSLYINAFYSPDTAPEWIYNSTYGDTDYDYHYLTSSDTTHDLESTVLNYLSIYADGELIYDRGTTIDDEAYTFSSGIGVELQITDVVNATTATFYSTGNLTNNVTTIDEFVIIHSVSPQNIYVFDDETMNPFHLMNNVEFDIYRNQDTVLKDTVENSTYKLNWFYGALVISYDSNTKNIIFSNKFDSSLSTPYAIDRTNETSTWTVVYTSNAIDTFDEVATFNHPYGDGSISVSFIDLQTVELETSLTGLISTQIDITSYISTLQVGKSYKFTYDGIYSSFDLDYTQHYDKFSPIYIPGVRKNIDLYVSSFYYDDSVVFEYQTGMKFYIKLNDIEFYPDDPTIYKLYIEEVVTHDVEFITPTVLGFNHHALMSMHTTKRSQAAQMAIKSLDSLDGQLVEHFDYADDPTIPFIEETQNKFTIVEYYDEDGFPYDFETPVVEDELLNPVILPNYNYEVVFNSMGGSAVETQYLFDDQTLVQPVSPYKEGYTFDGWYYLPDFSNDLDTPIAQLNNHSLREVFEDTSLFDSLQLVMNGGPEFITTTDWIGASSSATLSVSGGDLLATGTGSSNISTLYYITNIVPSSGVKYYLNTKVKVNNALATSMSIYLGDSTVGNPVGFLVATQSSPLNGTSYNLSGVLAVTTQAGFIRFYANTVYGSTANATGAVTQYDYSYIFNISTLILNKQYSPIFNTTFDLMSDADIKSTMDLFVQFPYLFIDYETLGIDTLTVEQMDYWYSVYQYITADGEMDLTDAVEYDFNDPLDSSLTLFAKWTENPPASHSITFNSTGGSYVSPTSTTTGSTVTRPSDPYKEGYIFKGWSETTVGDVLWNFTTDLVEEDLTLYAVWELPTSEIPEDPFDNEIIMGFIDYWYYIVAFILVGGLLLGFGRHKKGGRRRWR